MGQHLSRTVAEGVAFMQLIDGQPADALSGERIDVASPSDGKVFASIPSAGQADVEIRVPHFGYADRIQEVHIKIIHILILLIEKMTL